MAALVLCHTAGAQAPAPALGKFKPSDIYFQAWLTVREAEKAEKEGKFLDAFNRYDKAKQLFDSVSLSSPEFKPDLVKTRQQATTEAMGLIKEKAIAEQRKQNRRAGDLVEGPGAVVGRKDFEIPQLSKEDQRKVTALQGQIAQYRSELQSARSDRDANAIRLRQTLRDLEAQRDRVAQAPVAGQLNDLSRRIRKVENERDVMFKALQNSRTEHKNLDSQLKMAKADAAAAQKRADDLEEVVKVQQGASKQAVEGLRRQLKERKVTLVEKDKQYSALQARNAQLKKQLTESRAEILDLRDERDTLLVERDQMAALLKLNESDRVRLLIKQNMDLGRDLKVARDRLTELHSDNNATKDQLIEARRDLAHAKGRLIEFKRENSSQKSRLEDLEARLRNAGTELEKDLKVATAIDPKTKEEMEMLRDIIARQLRIQEHRKEAKQAVMAEIRKMGQQSSPFAQGVTDLLAQDLKLSAEESQLIANFKIDDDFIFSDRPNQTEVINAAQQLQQSISIKDQLARRAFSNGRFLAAREVFESILDEHPGHVDTMLNLGVVHVKNNEIPAAISSFNDAIVIRGNNLPFAHFMIGVCHYRIDDLEKSRLSLHRALELDGKNAKAYVFLGNVAGHENKDHEAENHFKTAIQIDPTLADPYYNLAVIYLRQGNKPVALQFYREALKRGADPNLEFEASLALR